MLKIYKPTKYIQILQVNMSEYGSAECTSEHF